MESGSGAFGILVGVATIVGAIVTVLAYLQARRRHAISDVLSETAAPEPPASERPRPRSEAALTFTERARIEPPSTLLSDGRKFRSADLSPDGRLVAAVASGHKRALVYSGATGALAAVLRTPRSLMATDGVFERCLFHPRFRDTGLLAYVREHAAGVSLHQLAYNRGFEHRLDLTYAEGFGDYAGGAAAWSPTGEYFGIGCGSETRSEGGETWSYTLWDVSDGTVDWRTWLEGSTEHHAAHWNRKGDLLFVKHHMGGAIIAPRERSISELRAIGGALGVVFDAAWHPSERVLLIACGKGIAFVDVDKGEVTNVINDVESGTVTIRRPYRQRELDDIAFVTNAASEVAFSPDGALLASSDCWGNVVVRRACDLEVERIYEVNSSPGGRPTRIHWIPCDDDGLVMQCHDADHELLTYFANVGEAKEASLLPKLADGKYVWGARRGAAAVSAEAIVVYEYV